MADIELSVVKAHLKVLHDREDDLITIYRDAALQEFENYTRRKLYQDQAELDADGDDAPEHTAILNSAIIAGVLLLIGNMYEFRSVQATTPEGVYRCWQPYKVYWVA